MQKAFCLFAFLTCTQPHAVADTKAARRVDTLDRHRHRGFRAGKTYRQALNERGLALGYFVGQSRFLMTTKDHKAISPPSHSLHRGWYLSINRNHRSMCSRSLVSGDNSEGQMRNKESSIKPKKKTLSKRIVTGWLLAFAGTVRLCWSVKIFDLSDFS